MKQYHTDLVNLFVLDSNESINQNNIDNNKINYFFQCGSLLKYKNVCGMAALVPANDEMDSIGRLFKNEYESNTVYLLDDNSKKIPLVLFKEIVRFFYEAYKKHQCESMVYLLFNRERGDWKYLIPVQYNLSRSSVSYMDLTDDIKNEKFIKIQNNKEALEQHTKCLKIYNQLFDEGYYVAGTIHSHSNFSAFHSSVDDKDEMGFDGLHITVGNLDSQFTYASRYIIGGAVYDTAIKDVVHSLKDKLNISDINFNESDLKYLIFNKFATNILTPPLWWPNHKEESNNGNYNKSFYENYTDNCDDFDDSDDEIEDYIVYEDDGFRLYNPESGRIFWIHRDNYYIFQKELDQCHKLDVEDAEKISIKE